MLATVDPIPSAPSHLPRDSPQHRVFFILQDPRPLTGDASCFRYGDSDDVGFRHLRILNEDKIESSTGVGANPHREFEIFSYTMDGELEQCVLQPLSLVHRLAHAEHYLSLQQRFC